MISKFPLFAAALAGVLVCSVAGAQVRVGSSSMGSVKRASLHARSATRASANSAGSAAPAIPSIQRASVIQISPSGRVTTAFVPFTNSFNFDGTSGVPGLGFDFPHLAAISGGLGNNSSSHFGHNGRRGQGSFVPILFGGYPYYYDDPGYDPSDQQSVPQSQPQPQVIVIQQPVSSQQGADSGSDTGKSFGLGTGFSARRANP